MGVCAGSSHASGRLRISNTGDLPSGQPPFLQVARQSFKENQVCTSSSSMVLIQPSESQNLGFVSCKEEDLSVVTSKEPDTRMQKYPVSIVFLKRLLKCFLDCLVDSLLKPFSTSIYFFLVSLLWGQCVSALPGSLVASWAAVLCVICAVDGKIRISKPNFLCTSL